MASIRLLPDPATPHGKMIAETVQALYVVQQNLSRLIGVMGMIVRSPTDLVDADFEPLATELHMPFVTPEDIQSVKDIFYLVAAASDKAQDGVLLDFVKRCDQGG
jgi:hypothetical protein